MLKGKLGLLSLALLILVNATVLAQDNKKPAKDKKEKKEKVEKAKKEAKDTKTPKKDTKTDAKASKSTTDGDDNYPYPESDEKEYKDFVKAKHQEQQDKYLDGKYAFPAPPRNKWELGLDLGTLHVSGDINSQRLDGKFGNIAPGFGIGAHLRKSLGYVFSLRLSAFAGNTQGFNWRGAQGWNRDGDDGAEFLHNGALGGEAYYQQFNEGRVVPDYRDLNGEVVFYNYKTKIRHASIEGLVNLNNIKFHKRRNNWSIHGIFGVGAYIFNTKMDMLDANGNEYDFSSAIAADYSIDANRKDIKKILRDLSDGDFESQAQIARDDYWIFGGEKDDSDPWTFRPAAHVGIGFQAKLSNRVNLGLETKVYYADEDLLDGQQWQEWGAQTKDWDRPVFTSASLNINLGKKNSVEPLWWMNPIDHTASKDDCCDDFKLADADGDGVPDMFDEEPNSRKDCPVDTRGRMLDSDGDKILDCDDCQPHTPRHLIDKINDCGAAFEKCCVDTVIIERVVETRPATAPCDAMGLPSILFDLNHYGIKPAFGPQLASVAAYMNANPGVRLCVVGHTDNRSGDGYNDILSWKRANEVINKLVTEYGISRSRLALQYRGEGDPVVGGLTDGAARKGIDAQHALNRRVDFKCCMEGQSDMAMPAGPADAGRK